MERRTVVVLVSLLVLAGCASRVRDSPFSIPEVGAVEQCGIGEGLVQQGRGVQQPVLVVSKNLKIEREHILKGRYPFDSENATRIKFRGGPQEIFVRKADNKICLSGVTDLRCGDVPHSIGMQLVSKASVSFQQNLIYRGKNGNRITLGYREFSNDPARPGVNADVAFDLSDSQIVEYKGARIEVLEATGTLITYQLLSGFAPQ